MVDKHGIRIVKGDYMKASVHPPIRKKDGTDEIFFLVYGATIPFLVNEKAYLIPLCDLAEIEKSGVHSENVIQCYDPRKMEKVTEEQIILHKLEN